MVQLVTVFLAVCCLTGLVCLCVGALGDLLGTIVPVVVGANRRCPFSFVID
ncbi:hypothetical protein NC651_006100 [Populus alba x Populus x berolinensis]|nr:hypothetical protein NC651_006100 [Populus alba x Populus x berolinensis]